MIRRGENSEPDREKCRCGQKAYPNYGDICENCWIDRFVIGALPYSSYYRIVHLQIGGWHLPTKKRALTS